MSRGDSRPPLVLGVAAYHRNSAAALVGDGQVLAASEQERYDGQRHSSAFPTDAIRGCLEAAGRQPEDVTDVAFFWQPLRGLPQRALHIARNLPDSLGFAGSHGGKWVALMRAEQACAEALGGRGRFRFHRVAHHRAHAASAFLLSPFPRAAVVTMDAAGEWWSTTISAGDGPRLRHRWSESYPHSLGFFYSAVTQYLGFAPGGHEGKTMGLAPYGDERFVEEMRELLQLRPGGHFRLALDYFDFQRNAAFLNNDRLWVSPRFVARFGPPRGRDDAMQPHHEAVAFAAQKVLEEAAIHLVRHAIGLTGEGRVCLAGGVALNAVLNGRLLADSEVDALYVQPAANDAGCALGAAAMVYTRRASRPAPMLDACLGEGYDDAAQLAALNAAGIAYESFDDASAAADAAAELIAEGRILGWFQGRMEFGPRALGHRSIIVDPSRPEMKDTLNARVKFREGFRPFAPMVLAERRGELFAGEHPAPFMTECWAVHPEAQPKLPAITHVDGTARLQTVHAEREPLLHRLISSFAARGGLPVLLNTSFNIKGRPIVRSPADAVRCFQETAIDALVMGRHIARKAER